MGLCFSTRRAKGEGPTHPLPIPASSAGRELLPEPEESVKEVLSETPAKPPMQNAVSVSVEKFSEISSDICSLSDTHSVSTEKRAEPEREISSPACDRKNCARRVEVACGAGSVGRTYSARAERNRALPVMKGTRSRSEEMKSTSPATNRARWHSGEMKLTPPVITAPRRHSGEMKQPKRSASPMVKQQPSQRPPRSLSAPRMTSSRNGKASPIRVPAPDLGRRKVPTVANSEGNESLENPLVSMECFIFL